MKKITALMFVSLFFLTDVAFSGDVFNWVDLSSTLGLPNGYIIQSLNDNLSYSGYFEAGGNKCPFVVSQEDGVVELEVPDELDLSEGHYLWTNINNQGIVLAYWYFYDSKRCQSVIYKNNQIFKCFNFGVKKINQKGKALLTYFGKPAIVDINTGKIEVNNQLLIDIARLNKKNAKMPEVRQIDINDSGVICGIFGTSGSWEAFIWNEVSGLTVLEGRNPERINNFGEVISVGDEPYQTLYFKRADESPKALDNFISSGLNDLGEVFGHPIYNPSCPMFLWDGTSMHVENDIFEITAINNKGDLLATVRKRICRQVYFCGEYFYVNNTLLVPKVEKQKKEITPRLASINNRGRTTLYPKINQMGFGSKEVYVFLIKKINGRLISYDFQRKLWLPGVRTLKTSISRPLSGVVIPGNSKGKIFFGVSLTSKINFNNSVFDSVEIR